MMGKIVEKGAMDESQKGGDMEYTRGDWKENGSRKLNNRGYMGRERVIEMEPVK